MQRYLDFISLYVYIFIYNERVIVELKGIYVRVPVDIHKKAKECALLRNITLQEWISRLLVQGIIRDTQYLNTEKEDCELKEAHCHCGGVCNKHCNTCHIDCCCLDYQMEQ